MFCPWRKASLYKRPKLFVTGYYKRPIMYLDDCEMQSRRKVLQICFITLVLWRGCETIKIWKCWWATISCSILKVKLLVIFASQRQRTKTHDRHQMHAVISSQYCPDDNGWKLTRVLNQRVYANPATQVSVYSPAYPSPAKSRGILWPWFLSVTCVHLNYCLCVMQGKNRHAMRSGCALWLIVKCCPGAHCQTPLNGLHSRKQSVAVTKGLVGTGPVMIDLQWISEDVSENWVSPVEFRSERVPIGLECAASHQLKTSVGSTRKGRNPFYWFNFACLENTRCLGVSNHKWYCPMRQVNWHDKLCVFAYIIHTVC